METTEANPEIEAGRKSAVDAVVMPEFVELPITQHFDRSKLPVGVVKIRRDALPERPDWFLSLGFKILEQKDGKPTKYEPKEMAILSDSEVKAYLDSQA